MDSERNERTKNHRLKYIQSLIIQFDEVMCDGNLIGSPKLIAERIEKLYWECRDKHLRKHMNNPAGSIDHHKIASLLEYCIMGSCLIRLKKHEGIDISEKNDEIIRLNARFALFSAISVLHDWCMQSNKFDITELSKLDEGAFFREHTSLLCKASHEIESFPLFSNSATLYFAERYCIAVSR